ncbi:MAG: DUF3048 domain-containing protein [Tissierellia bacterium]|nr:DUF3048 domain-containing protein [Tissierellia bacterium]
MQKLLKLIFPLSLLMVLGTACSGGQAPENNKTQAENSEADLVQEEEKTLAPLTGLEIDPDLADARPFAIMLDNHPNARPQSGLAQADLVYEFKVEGEFTRHLAIFQSQLPDYIGPIRSARPYFAQTAAGHEAIYAHWGGSEAGYQEVAKLGLDHLDGIALEGISFKRDQEFNKRAPHNGYSSKDLLLAAAKEAGISTQAQVPSLDFYKDGEAPSGEEATEISCNFFPSYTTQFNYLADKKAYEVFRQDEKVVDESSQETLYPTNVIVLFAPSRVTGPKDTLTIESIGQGQGMLFQGGKALPINWEKETASSPTSFMTEEGDPIKYLPGQTWILVLDNETELDYQEAES